MVTVVPFQSGEEFEGVTIKAPLPALGDIQSWEVAGPEGPAVLFCVHRRGAMTQAQIEGFKKRALALSKVTADYLPQIGGYGYSAPRRCLWLLCDGPPRGSFSLRRLYDKTRMVGIRFLHLGIFAAMTRTLADADDAGFHHYAITPERVYLDGKLSPCFLEHLGLIEVFGVEPPPPTYDTIAYVEPDLLRGERGAQADIYALGMILWELMARRPPYLETGSARVEVDEDFIEALERTPLPDLGAPKGDPPAFVFPFLARITAKQASERPADWDAVIDEVEAVATAWIPLIDGRRAELASGWAAGAREGAAGSKGGAAGAREGAGAATGGGAAQTRRGAAAQANVGEEARRSDGAAAQIGRGGAAQARVGEEARRSDGAAAQTGKGGVAQARVGEEARRSDGAARGSGGASAPPSQTAHESPPLAGLFVPLALASLGAGVALAALAVAIHERSQVVSSPPAGPSSITVTLTLPEALPPASTSCALEPAPTSAPTRSRRPFKAAPPRPAKVPPSVPEAAPPTDAKPESSSRSPASSAPEPASQESLRKLWPFGR